MTMSENSKYFYMGNQKLKRSNVPVNFTKQQVKEYIKCSSDIVYFVKKYVKIVNVDQGIVPFNLWPFQEEMINTFANNRFSICKLPRQVGKALDINTDIPTSRGWKKLKDIQVGDTLYDMYGNPTNVLFKSEIHYKPTYRVTFSDGSSVNACEDHIWYGYDYNGTNKYRKELREFTTKQIADTGVFLYNSEVEYRYAIPNAEPVRYSEKQLLVDPYLLGLWLGDGSSQAGRITILEDDFNSIKHLITCNYKIYRYDSKNDKILTVAFDGLTSKLKELNVLNNKHIPSEYLTGSIKQRRELLKGLLDTDGTVSNYSVSFTQAVYRDVLVSQVKELISSLGYKVSEYHYKDTKHPSITIRFVSHDEKSFNLVRKSDKQKIASSTKVLKRQIVNIELIPTIPTQCIQVDSETKTFLCTRDYIVTHNTTVTAATILWYILFHENYSVALLAHKLAQAREILGRIQLAYENLPKWMQQGVVEWNKTSVELENGSKILAAATSSSAIRGGSFNLIYLDEFAFVPPHFQGDFFASVYPTISSGNTTKVIITSTPKGLNMFYKMWSEAVDGKNSFVPFEVHWSDVPGRDEKWKEETIRNTSERQFREEFETEFIGSSSTLINPGKLLQLPIIAPMKYTDDYAVYEDPSLEENKNNLYVLVADTSRGVGRDYSAFVVYNVTQLPYKVAARYKNNEISPLLFPNIIHQFAKMYNDAYTCIEVNDNGQQVADILYRELEYENVVMTQMRGRQGQMISGGFASKPTPGVRTTAQVKRIGCTNFKTLVEADKLILGDAEILDELYRFVETGDSYAAEEGAHDDLAMCCVIFAWMTMQPYFKEWTDTNVREKIQQDNLKLLDEEFLPFEISTGEDVYSYEGIREMSGRSFNRWLLSEND